MAYSDFFWILLVLPKKLGTTTTMSSTIRNNTNTTERVLHLFGANYWQIINKRVKSIIRWNAIACDNIHVSRVPPTTGNKNRCQGCFPISCMQYEIWNKCLSSLVCTITKTVIMRPSEYIYLGQLLTKSRWKIWIGFDIVQQQTD